jgi:hypothetical protein
VNFTYSLLLIYVKDNHGYPANFVIGKCVLEACVDDVISNFEYISVFSPTAVSDYKLTLSYSKPSEVEQQLNS